jgi:hypothetical protein
VPLPIEPSPTLAAPGGVDLDTVRAGEFDFGRMWTFEYPPTEYLRNAYGFAPDSSWYRKAMLGALRIPGCSASFVSPNGLVLTNHHCARDHVTTITREGETLLDDGFYAETLDEERFIEDFQADRLIDIEDVTDEVYAALEGIEDDAARSQAREEKLEEIEQRILAEHGGEGAGVVVEMISLYNGGRYSAYVLRRYTDTRMVLVPELQIGYFGGDPDNFTYPRYNLDFSFLRIYEDGEPLDTSDDYFRWSQAGVSGGDIVFVVGNPGSTSRLQTVSELEFRRDVSDRGVLDFIDSRVAVLQAFYEEDPGAAEALDLRNTVFSMLNSQKAYRGILKGLHDPIIMAKRQDAEDEFLEDLKKDPALWEQYGELVDLMAEVQERKRAVAPGFAAFLGLSSPDLGSATLVRALYAFQYLAAQSRGASEDDLTELKEGFLGVPQQPLPLEEALVQARLQDLVNAYGRDHVMVEQILGGRSPEGAASVIVSTSLLADSTRAAQALEGGTLMMNDPAIEAFTGMLQGLGPFQQTAFSLSTQEEEIGAALGRARFEIYGTARPPDATFSLRIADGVVKGYEYNGTIAPIYTTFYGLYDHYYSYGQGEGAGTEWDLPQRWLAPPETFDLSTPLNFVATADIIGGNSGSPVVNLDLDVVGLVFDGNIESLPGDYIFQTEVPRTVAVDVRGIVEALEEIYQAERIVEELTTRVPASH